MSRWATGSWSWLIFVVVLPPKNCKKTRRQEGKEKFEAELETLQADNKSGEVCWCFRVFPNVADVGAFEAGLAAAREALATSRQSEQEAQAKQAASLLYASHSHCCKVCAEGQKKVSSNRAQMNMICRKKLSSNSNEGQVSKLNTYKTYSQYIQVELDMPGGALESRGELCHRRTAGRKLGSLPHQRSQESHVNVAWKLNLHPKRNIFSSKASFFELDVTVVFGCVSIHCTIYNFTYDIHRDGLLYWKNTGILPKICRP